MDFAKGCYIGQEILSRIKTTGKMPRELITWQAGCELAAEAEILNAEGKVVGQVTSATTHPETGACIGLGFVRQGTSSDGLTASGTALQRR
jgi:folate-binding Fe-S cluster repair protein YgfZ